MVSDRAARIRIASRALKYATRLVALATGALYVAAFAAGPDLPGAAAPLDRVALFLAGVMPLVLALAAMVLTARLFARFEAGRTLDAGSAALLSRIGATLCAAAFFGVAARTGASLWMAMRGGGGVDFTVGSGDVATFGVGLLLVVLGWVLGEAVAVAEENRQFV
jgi:hypothetical protein